MISLLFLTNIYLSSLPEGVNGKYYQSAYESVLKNIVIYLDVSMSLNEQARSKLTQMINTLVKELSVGNNVKIVPFGNKLYVNDGFKINIKETMDNEYSVDDLDSFFERAFRRNDPKTNLAGVFRDILDKCDYNEDKVKIFVMASDFVHEPPLNNGSYEDWKNEFVDYLAESRKLSDCFHVDNVGKYHSYLHLLVQNNPKHSSSQVNKEIIRQFYGQEQQDDSIFNYYELFKDVAINLTQSLSIDTPISLRSNHGYPNIQVVIDNPNNFPVMIRSLSISDVNSNVNDKNIFAANWVLDPGKNKSAPVSTKKWNLARIDARDVVFELEQIPESRFLENRSKAFLLENGSERIEIISAQPIIRPRTREIQVRLRSKIDKGGYDEIKLILKRDGQPCSEPRVFKSLPKDKNIIFKLLDDDYDMKTVILETKLQFDSDPEVEDMQKMKEGLFWKVDSKLNISFFVCNIYFIPLVNQISAWVLCVFLFIPKLGRPWHRIKLIYLSFGVINFLAQFIVSFLCIKTIFDQSISGFETTLMKLPPIALIPPVCYGMWRVLSYFLVDKLVIPYFTIPMGTKITFFACIVLAFMIALVLIYCYLNFLNGFYS